MTMETKQALKNNIEKLLTDLENTVSIGVLETMSPNDPEYYDILNEEFQEGVLYAMDLIEEYSE